ncbi:uncharacterized protein LOC108606889 [Drosophila busckii]|uniref:uncharacterized protein LOC108606889 n=1 Tax=Drosophila busckii TaxID=30019 RepID=UPI00083F2673|nr:uncharacterized protein LOC108606889 [Drosophila busckii]
MGTADTDKTPAAELLSADARSQRAKQRAFFKRRATQLGNGPNNWKLCTDLQRHWSRRRVRRLFTTDKVNSKAWHLQQKGNNPKQQAHCSYLYMLVSLLLVLVISCALYKNNDALSQFMQRYSSQYQAIVHNNLNYCNRSIPLRIMFGHIRGNVLNQDTALQHLQQALANQSSLQTIALVGSSGVGKSLTARVLAEQYPWKENVQLIAWNDFNLLDEEVRYQTLTSAFGRLAHCGRNLLIIDNMAMCDMEYVAAINRWLHARNDVASNAEETNADLKYLTILYIFNLNRMLTDEDYNKQLEALQQLPQTTVVNYRSFQLKDLERCIQHESLLEGLELRQQDIQDMLNSSDVRNSGCKNVRAKVLMYGQPPHPKESHIIEN